MHSDAGRATSTSGNPVGFVSTVVGTALADVAFALCCLAVDSIWLSYHPAAWLSLTFVGVLVTAGLGLWLRRSGRRATWGTLVLVGTAAGAAGVATFDAFLYALGVGLAG